VEFNRCNNVLIEGVTIKSAAFWSVHPVLSNNVTARGVIIDNPVVTTTAQQKHIPVIRNISFSNISCGPAGRAFYLPGTKETPIQNLLLQNVTIGSVEKQNILTHLSNPVADQVTIGGKAFSF
jgi:hypothetical protein